MYLIVGLGNPGREYVNTRHNIGFEAIDVLCGKYGVTLNKTKFRADCGEGFIAGEKAIFIKPQTYMNLSGESVREFAEFYKADIDHIIVLFDDVALPVGRLRVRPKGSAGGHNGIKNIIYQLGSEEFARVRIGIGAPSHPDFPMADYVLGRFSKDEIELLIPAVKRAADAVETIITDGVGAAMNMFNSAKDEA